MPDLPPFETHVVDNQPPAFEARDLWADDVALRDAMATHGARDHVGHVAAYARLAGDRLQALATDAHRDRPRLQTHDARGVRIDHVAFHPSYHALMQAAIGHGVAGLSWADSRPGAHVARAALSYLHAQAEPGTGCPLTMTHASVPVLRQEPALREWAEKAITTRYDASDVPIGAKPGVTLGMGMTEKQGGSDVRTNTTTATPRDDGHYALVGHKWFFSAPMSDGFLVLAQAPGGLSCFLMPRRLPDGAKNAFRILRLKDKLGDWSNASAEVEFTGARAQRIGDENKGISTILEMVMLTRLDCMLGSAALMRAALSRAIHHCRHRRAFGRPLIEQPLMRNVLADMALESEAALAFAMRVARAVDAAPRDAREAAFARIATAIGKYWICKRTAGFVNEAQECLGGNGYVEESVLPRLYRQAPLNSIWEGSGNIQCLDVLRALTHAPGTAEVLRDALQPVDGGDALAATLLDGRPVEQGDARRLVERLALALQASILRTAGSPIADAFAASRVAAPHLLGFGTLPSGIDTEAIVARALPVP